MDGAIETMWRRCLIFHFRHILVSLLRKQRRLKMTNDGLNLCVADIWNKIYEAGLLRTDEKMVLIAGSCVLLEHFTGKSTVTTWWIYME